MNLGGVIHLNKRGFFILLTIILIIALYSLRNGYVEVAESELNLHSVLEVAIKSAENGGKEVVAIKDNTVVKSKGLTKEGMKDDVTTADYLSHCSMVATIKHYFPNVKLISEENTDCDSNQFVDFKVDKANFKELPDEFVDEKDVTVWIDPLDATHEYTEKLYEYVTTMVCVAVKGQPIIGVIHKPFSKETSWSWLGKGKSENLNIQKNGQDHVKKVIISRSHSGNIKEVLKTTLKDKFEVVIAAGAGYKALEVATGKVDAYLHITAIKKWDICAGNAILNAVNGQMTTKHNKKIDYTDKTNIVNEDGLIATLQNHEDYLGSL